MRDTFQKEMELIDQDVVRMGALVEKAVEEANLALAENDRERAARVMAADDQVDAFFISIEQQALVILAQQQPVARDLRLIITILRAVNELERTGDLAFNIAKVVVETTDLERPRPLRTLIYELGEACLRIMGRAIDAWATKDLDLATAISEMDDEIDSLYAELFGELVAVSSETDFQTAMNLVLVGRWFERIADHAVNISEGIRYYITGDMELLG
jgi:phosphate transport system protein